MSWMVERHLLSSLPLQTTCVKERPMGTWIVVVVGRSEAIIQAFPVANEPICAIAVKEERTLEISELEMFLCTEHLLLNLEKGWAGGLQACRNDFILSLECPHPGNELQEQNSSSTQQT